MEGNIGTTIEKIRIEKNILITVLIKGIISRSQYYKIVNNHSEISAIKFLKLIDRLNVTLDEFVFIANNFKNEYTTYFLLINQHFSDKNTFELLKTKEQLLELFNQTTKQKYWHFYLLTSALINRIEGNSIDDHLISHLKAYFSNLNYFTRYDLALYSNTMFIYPFEYNTSLLKRILKRLSKFDNFKQNEKEIIKILSNMIILSLQKFEISHVKKYIKLMSSIPIQDEFIYEQIIVRFFKGILLFLSGEKAQGLKISTNCIDFLQNLENKNSHILLNIINFCKKNQL